MTKAEQYRKAYVEQNPETVAEWLLLAKTIDEELSMSSTDIGVCMHFSDGSIWRLGGSNGYVR